MDLIEAVNTQTLIDWLINPHATTPDQADAARDAAAWLADRARTISHAGPTSAHVLLTWHDLLQGCPGCPTCTTNPHHDDDHDGQDDDQDGQDDDRAARPVLSEADVAQLVDDGWLTPVPAGEATATGPSTALARGGGDVVVAVAHGGGTR